MDSDNGRLFSQPSHSFTDESPHHNSMLTVTGLNLGKGAVHGRKEDSRWQLHRLVTIGILPDDALLEVFYLYMNELEVDYDDDWWHMLVHVCRRWRSVVFASPRRLNLQLRCSSRRSVKEMLDIWPELPLIISDIGDPGMDDAENVIAALQLNDCVSQIRLWDVSSSELEQFATVMVDPYPSLTHLTLWSTDEMTPLVIPESFMGGAAPCLQSLDLNRIPFPALPELLLSAIDLVELSLLNIPHTGYISPQAMVACLSVLTRLKEISLTFLAPRSRPNRVSRRRLTHTILPNLTHLRFKGVTEYLEDFVARIDTPLLEDISIRFFNQLVFDIFHLPKFLSRAEKFTVLNQADVVFRAHSINFMLPRETRIVDPIRLYLEVLCSSSDWQLSSLAQVCNKCLSALPTLERIDILEDQGSPPDWQDDIEYTQWVELLNPFTTVKDLYLSNEVAPHVASALQELSGEETTEVLPALQNLFYDGLLPSGPAQEAIEKFVAARQLSGQPVAIHRQERGEVGNESGGQ